jgi:hypothetical protein
MRTFPRSTRVAAALAGLCLAAAVQAQAPTPSAAPTVAPPPGEPSAQAGTGADGPSLAWSGFGTLGWAQSNRRWTHQRFVDRQGGFERDSVLGAQLDAQLSPSWSATVQAKLAPSERQDNAWALSPAWAFLAWRPGNDWLLRAGKLRVPFFLRSEHMDVGATYDEARLPADIYAVVPTSDFRGLHLTYSGELGGGDLNLDAYRGESSQFKRVWVREGLPGLVDAGALIREGKVKATGLILTWTGPAATKARAGWHHFSIEMPDGKALPLRPTWAPLGPGIGYWQTDAALPGPGVETVPRFDNSMLTMGVEFRPAAGWTVIGEYGRIRQFKTERSLDSTAGYLTVSRDIGPFTPYLTYSRLFSSRVSRDWARTLDETTVPGAVPGSALLNASMRVSADSVPVYDQYALALGGAWNLSPAHKLKAEWQHTRAKAPGLFDLPAGEPLFRPRSVDLLSLSYSFVF